MTTSWARARRAVGIVVVGTALSIPGTLTWCAEASAEAPLTTLAPMSPALVVADQQNTGDDPPAWPFAVLTVAMVGGGLLWSTRRKP